MASLKKANKTGAMTAADAATATIAFMALKANRWAGEQEATMNAAEATTNTPTEWRPQNNLRVKHCFFERVPWHKLNAVRIEPDEGGFWVTSLWKPIGEEGPTANKKK